MKKYFWTGLVIFLPLVLTLLITIAIINFFTDPFVRPVEHFLIQLPLKNSSLSYLLLPESITIISKAIVLVVFLLLLSLIGFLIQHLFGNYILELSNKIFYKIPIFNRIYGLFQEMIPTLFATNPKDFKVVLTKFPQSECYGIGVLTKEKSGEMTHVTVLMSGTNPTICFPLVFKEEDLIALDANAEEVLKFVLSYGMINDAFK